MKSGKNLESEFKNPKLRLPGACPHLGSDEWQEPCCIFFDWSQSSASHIILQILGSTLLTEVQGVPLQHPTQPSCSSFLRLQPQLRGLVPEECPWVWAEGLCQEPPCWSYPLAQGEVLCSGVSAGNGQETLSQNYLVAIRHYEFHLKPIPNPKSHPPALASPVTSLASSHIPLCPTHLLLGLLSHTFTGLLQ